MDIKGGTLLVHIGLMFIGFVLILLAYLVGIEKLTWLLSGFNQRRVRDNEKLARIVGVYNLLVGIVLVILSFLFSDSSEEAGIGLALSIVALGYVLLAIYVHATMVDK